MKDKIFEHKLKEVVHRYEMVEEEKNDWNNHVELGQWADFMLIAPVTAKTMAKMVSGECDNLLLATYLSAKCPVYFAPAMDLDMYKHPSTIEKLPEFLTANLSPACPDANNFPEVAP